MYRIDHIGRHLKAILVEYERPFTRKKIINRELVQIVIRLTSLVEDLMKEKNNARKDN